MTALERIPSDVNKRESLRCTGTMLSSNHFVHISEEAERKYFFI
jgi:hypothetical protein